MCYMLRSRALSMSCLQKSLEAGPGCPCTKTIKDVRVQNVPKHSLFLNHRASVQDKAH